MFSALRRLAKPGDGRDSSTPAPMSSTLQKRFSRGVNYNMKILIKGDRNVGKSCLLQRLQGGPFVEEYRPTDQIQVAPIHWSYKMSDHIVKVEVWEVVDKGKAKKRTPIGLKLENQPSGAADIDAFETPALDATFLDVYKNANGVILIMDITKPWTFDYVQRELGSIPSDIPVIILGNHCDMHHHRQVHNHEIEQFISSAKQSRSGSIRYAESSMRNGFGLRLLHKFFNVPFLKLQRSTLLEQLNRNEHDTVSANKELDMFQRSEDSDYSLFLERLASKKTGGQSVPPPPILEKSPSIVLGGGKPIVPSNINPLIGSVQTEPKAIVVKTIKTPDSPIKASDVDKLTIGTRIQEEQSLRSTPKAGKPSPLNNLDDFCPGALDNSFLDDFSPGGQSFPRSEESPRLTLSMTADSESDTENSSNPMVMVVQDDVDSDEERSATFKPIKIAPKTKMAIPPAAKEPSAKIFESTKLDSWNKPIEDRNYGEDSFWRFEKRYGNEEAVGGLQIDASLRRSPEGGEDPDTESAEVKLSKKKDDKKPHKKSKKSKDKDEKSEINETRDRKTKEKRHKKKNSDELLEEFLSGKTDGVLPAQEAYEEF